DAASILADTPMLRTKEAFAAPRNAQLPGGFEDPVGWFSFVDASVFPPGAEQFLQRVLKVTVLSFHDYIDLHLEEILDEGPTKEQYVAILTLVAQRRLELEGSGTLEVLANRAIVRTKAGSFV